MVKDAVSFLITIDGLTSVENIGDTAGNDEPECIFTAKYFDSDDDWRKQSVGCTCKNCYVTECSNQHQW